MTKKTTTKILHYLRAQQSGQPFDLQSMVKKARKKEKTVEASEVKLGGEEIVRIQHYSDKGNCVRVHLTRYLPGVPAETLQPKAPAEEDDEETQAPPKGREFKDGDAFLYIKNYHLLYCGHGISQSKVESYLSQLFFKAGLKDESSLFELVPTGNVDKLKLLQDHGVRSIQLSVSAFDASLPRKQRKNWFDKGLGAFGDELSALMSKEYRPETLKALEDLIVYVEVKLDRNTQAVQAAQDFIGDLAEPLLDKSDPSDDSFTIITQKDEKITASDIRLRTSVTVDRQANSISYISVWERMDAYFDELTKDRLLEQ